MTLTDRALIFEGPVPWAAGGGGPIMRGRPGFVQPRFGPGPAAGLHAGELRIPLWRCRGASAVPGPSGTGLNLQLLSRQVFFATNEAEAWSAAIEQARLLAPPAPPGALAGAGGRAAMPRCEYCGQLSAATATKCEHCGAPF